MTEREPNARDLIRVIKEERQSANIEGRHILSNQLINDPQRIGDGYLISEDPRGTGNLSIVIIDISLGKSRHRNSFHTNESLREVMESGEVDDLIVKIPIGQPPSSKRDELITESKMLDDLKRLLNVFIKKDVDLVRDPTALLNVIRDLFSPVYLIRPYGTRRPLWGYSLSAAYLDQQKKVITVASIGKNFVGKQSSGKEGKFSSVFGDNSKFFSPEKTTQGVGGPVRVKTTRLVWGQSFIMATDGIYERKRFPFPPKIVLQQMSDKELLDSNNEGFYLVIKTK